MDLCRIRSYRIWGMAIFDWVLTLIGAYILNWYVFPRERYWKVLILTVFIGIVTHRVMGIPTMFNYYLGVGEMPERGECE